MVCSSKIKESDSRLDKGEWRVRWLNTEHLNKHKKPKIPAQENINFQNFTTTLF